MLSTTSMYREEVGDQVSSIAGLNQRFTCIDVGNTVVAHLHYIATC